MESLSFRIRLIRVVVCSTSSFELASKLVLILRASYPLSIDSSRHFIGGFGRLAMLLSDSR
jgi:hypothetical protein